MNRRLGKFTISREIIEEHPKHVQRIMGMCVIYKAEFLMHMNAVEYTALCDLFKELPLGWEPERYRWVVTEVGDIVLDRE